jgi:hypothetical protein
MADTLDQWPTMATEIQDADLLPLKRGIGINSDKSILGSAVKTQFQTAYIGQNLQTGTSYELVLADAGKMLDFNNASPIAVTIPANASVPFPVDTRIDLNQSGAGLYTVGITSDTLIVAEGAVSRGQHFGMSLWKKSATVWVLYGGTSA